MDGQTPESPPSFIGRYVNATILVQALIALSIVWVICALALRDPTMFKDAIINMGMVAIGYWLGSSRSSQAKDDKSGGTQ